VEPSVPLRPRAAFLRRAPAPPSLRVRGKRWGFALAIALTFLVPTGVLVPRGLEAPHAGHVAPAVGVIGPGIGAVPHAGATFPYGNVSLICALPNASLPADSKLSASYAFHVVKFPSSPAAIHFRVPGMQATFPEKSGGQLGVWIFGQNFTVSGTGTQGGSATTGSTTIGSSGAQFVNGSSALMTSELIAIQNDVPWGTVQIDFAWSWQVVPASGGNPVASGQSSSLTVGPQEYVNVSSAGPSEIMPGQTYTVCLTGPTMLGRTLSLHMEVPNPYYAFAWNTTTIPSNASSPFCWGVTMPSYFHQLPTALLVHIWSYSTQPGILNVLHLAGIPREAGTLAGEVQPTDAKVNLSGLSIAVSPSGQFRQLVDVGTYFLAASAPHYASTGRYVTLSNNTVTWANLSLSPLPGSLEGLVSPATARVSVDGQPVAVAQGRYSIGLAPGEYELKANATGYRPLSENVSVAPGIPTWANISLPLIPLPERFGVTFAEVGLPAPPNWSLLANGTLRASNGSAEISVLWWNGTYGYSVVPVPGFTASPSVGTVDVTGGPTRVAIVFTPHVAHTATFPVHFLESGLPAGISWSVVVNGSPVAALAPSPLVVELANGSYPYSVPADSGYGPTLASGQLYVEGRAVSVDVGFVALPLPARSPRGTQPSNELAPLLGVVAGLGIAGMIGVALLLRRRGRGGR
jgi:hypothetical protein